MFTTPTPRNATYLPLLLLALLLSLTTAHAAGIEDSSPASTELAPASEFNLENYRGQLLYLDFWASWCGPCKASFPWMKRLQSRYKNEGLQIVAVSVDNEADAAEKFLARYQPNFEIVADPDGTLAKQYQLLAMPSSYLIGPQGEILWSHKGFRKRDQQVLEEKIQTALKTSLSPSSQTP